MRLPFGNSKTASDLRKPDPTVVPEVPEAYLAALYRSARVGGDFFDFLRPNPVTLLLVLTDIAGEREMALHVASHVQDVFRKRGMELFPNEATQQSDALTALTLEMNRAIIGVAKDICCAPAFVGSYDLRIHMLTYVNAGHTPGLMRDADGISVLEANGLPLGLFSHATHDTQFCALRPNAFVTLVSKGLLESRTEDGEFGMERVKRILGSGRFPTARAVCQTLLDEVHSEEPEPSWLPSNLGIPGLSTPEPNDVTTLTLMRRL